MKQIVRIDFWGTVSNSSDRGRQFTLIYWQLEGHQYSGTSINFDYIKTPLKWFAWTTLDVLVLSLIPDKYCGRKFGFLSDKHILFSWIQNLQFIQVVGFNLMWPDRYTSRIHLKSCRFLPVGNNYSFELNSFGHAFIMKCMHMRIWLSYFIWMQDFYIAGDGYKFAYDGDPMRAFLALLTHSMKRQGS